MTFGLTSSGFTPKKLSDVLSDFEDSEHALISPALDVSSDQPIGQLNGIYAAKIAELWELLSVVVSAFDRPNAEGVMLDNTGNLTGTPRLAPTATVVDATVNLNAGVTLPAGSKACVPGFPAVSFSLQTAVTNAGGSPADVTTAVFVCDSTGPNVVNSSTLTQILTPVAGWNTVTNPSDGTTGTNAETDTAYRVRQIQDLNAQGSSDLDSIVRAVADLPGMIQVIGLENTTLIPDVNGLPGKSFEIIAWDGSSPVVANNDIAKAIWSEKPSGIQAFGALTGTTVDGQGITRTISFARATQLTLYLSLTITRAATGYAGDTAVKNALMAYAAANLLVGSEVVGLALRSVPLTLTGIVDVPTFTLGFSSSPVGTANLSPTQTQIAVLDPSRIIISYT